MFCYVYAIPSQVPQLLDDLLRQIAVFFDDENMPILRTIADRSELLIRWLLAIDMRRYGWVKGSPQ